MKLSKHLGFIYAIAIICSVVLIIGYGVQNTPDTTSYINAWDNYLEGKLDMLRTPVYPIFLGICRTVLGTSNFQLSAIIVQHIVFLISICYFNKSVVYLLGDRKLSFWITFFYAICPGFISWNNYILTEPFALAGMVFLLYCSIKLYVRPTCQIALTYTFWLLFLIFLRPSFLYLIPVYLCLWLLLGYRNKKLLIYGISCTMAVVCLEGFYIYEFKQMYGVYTPSSVSSINQYYIIRQHGLISIDYIDNKDLKQEIDNSIKTKGFFLEDDEVLWHEGDDLVKKYGLVDVQNIISTSLRLYPVELIKKAGGRAVRAISLPLCHNNLSTNGAVFLSFVLNFLNIGYLYTLLLIYLFIVFYWLFRKGVVPVFSLLIFMLGSCNLILVIIGAPAAWNRLILPSMPLYLLMFAQICTMFKIESPLK